MPLDPRTRVDRWQFETILAHGERRDRFVSVPLPPAFYLVVQCYCYKMATHEILHVVWYGSSVQPFDQFGTSRISHLEVVEHQLSVNYFIFLSWNTTCHFSPDHALSPYYVVVFGPYHVYVFSLA